VTEDVYLAAGARARVEIDRQLVACGWLVQNRAEMNLYASKGVAVREFIMASGHGRSDYLLFVDGKAVGHAARWGGAADRQVRRCIPSGCRMGCLCLSAW
jgi:hypothetical protein